MSSVVERLRGRLLSLTLKDRLTLLFAVGSSVALLAVLAVVYAFTTAQLRAAVDEGLRARARTIAVAAAHGDVLVVDQDPYAQVLDAQGRVVASSPAAPTGPVLSNAQVLIALNRTLDFQGSVPRLGDQARLLAVPVPDLGEVVVVGVSLDAVERGRVSMLLLLAAAAPVLVAGLTVAARRVVAAALSPVDALTRGAAAISATAAAGTLPVPAGEDEIGRLARTLNEMLARLHVAFARERGFVDDASHELRTPVSVLRGELELGLASDDPAEMRRSLEAAHAEARRIGALASDLLVLARESSGTLVVRSVDVDLVEAVESAGAPLREGLGLELSVVTADGTRPHGRCDPTRLGQVLTNLLTNAAAAGASRVQVRVGGVEGASVLEVCDDGPGFPPALLPTAFERFTRGDEARTRRGAAPEGAGGGAGLGLAIVAALVRAHGGLVSADNASPLGGARVTFTLPHA